MDWLEEIEEDTKYDHWPKLSREDFDRLISEIKRLREYIKQSTCECSVSICDVEQQNFGLKKELERLRRLPDRIVDTHQLSSDYESDARYTWPERWEELIREMEDLNKGIAR